MRKVEVVEAEEPDTARSHYRLEAVWNTLNVKQTAETVWSVMMDEIQEYPLS